MAIAVQELAKTIKEVNQKISIFFKGLAEQMDGIKSLEAQNKAIEVQNARIKQENSGLKEQMAEFRRRLEELEKK